MRSVAQEWIDRINEPYLRDLDLQCAKCGDKGAGFINIDPEDMRDWVDDDIGLRVPVVIVEREAGSLWWAIDNDREIKTMPFRDAKNMMGSE